MTLLRRFLRNDKASVALLFAYLSPVLLMFTGIAIDYTTLISRKTELQNAADIAAVGAARELAIPGKTDSEIASVADALVRANYVNYEASNWNSRADVKTGLLANNEGVSVTLKQEWKPFLIQYLNAGANPISVTATAKILGSGSLCVLGLLDYKRFAAVHMDISAKLSARDCAVYSNARNPYSVRLDGNSRLAAGLTCAAGGYFKSTDAVVEPNPITDCPQVEDPLASRPAPIVRACDHTNTVIDKDTTLRPGTYCGGLIVTGTARVTLKPGIYVIRNGPLTLTGEATLSGTGVGFYLTGNGSTLFFDNETHIDLAAPETGPLAGLLFFEDRRAPTNFDFDELGSNSTPGNVRIHRIASNDARRLIGTIYLSRSILMVEANAPVADQSAYTALIVSRLWLREGPTLILNADYSATDVPLPDGLDGVTKNVVLTN